MHTYIYRFTYTLFFASQLTQCFDDASKRKKVKVLLAQSCPTLCDPMDCSTPGSSVHGILQTRILQARELEPFPSPGDLPDPGIESRSLALPTREALGKKKTWANPYLWCDSERVILRTVQKITFHPTNHNIYTYVYVYICIYICFVFQ